MTWIGYSFSIELIVKLSIAVFYPDFFANTVTHVDMAYQVSDSSLHAYRKPLSTSAMAMRHNAPHRNNFPKLCWSSVYLRLL